MAAPSLWRVMVRNWPSVADWRPPAEGYGGGVSRGMARVCGNLMSVSDGLRSGLGHIQAGHWCGQVRSGAVALLLTGMLVVASVVAPSSAAAPAAGPASAPAAAVPSIGGCQIFPADNIWNTRIDSLPVHARSDAWISSIGASTGLKADFGSGLWEGYPIGIPYTTAPGSQAPVSIDFYYGGQSDPGPYRIPSDAPVEGGSDHHVLVVDRDRCQLTEVFDATRHSATLWSGGSGAIFDLNSHALRPDGWTSADAAGLPILPGLARYDEIAAGEIAHALRFTAVTTQRAYVWPARHFASSNTNLNVPPMGARVRLKSSVNISGFSPEVRIVLLALQRYGMFLADNGSNWYISGAPDGRWNNDNLRQLRQIVGSNLEFVDSSSLMLHPDSGQVRSPEPPPSCSPRPAARVETSRQSAGRLGVTIAAGVGSGAPNNRVRALRFGTLSNARVLQNGQPVASGARVAWTDSGPATFVVERVRSGQGVMVPLAVEDDCGDWSTFVGGGPSAF